MLEVQKVIQELREFRAQPQQKATREIKAHKELKVN
jgi:hypothetical protein